MCFKVVKENRENVKFEKRGKYFYERILKMSCVVRLLILFVLNLDVDMLWMCVLVI